MKQNRRNQSVSGIAAEWYYCALRIPRDGKMPVEIQGAFHMTRPAPPVSRSDSDGVVLELLTESGVLIDVIGVQKALACNCGCRKASVAPPFSDYCAWFPFYSAFARLRVVKGDKALQEFAVSAAAPKFNGHPTAVVDPDAETVSINWASDAADVLPKLTFGIRYSADGSRWTPLAAGLAGQKLSVGLRNLAGSETGIFEVVASAGFRTALARSHGIAIPNKLRSMTISSSTNNDQKIRIDQTVSVFATAFSPSFGNASPSDMKWTSDVGGYLGTGSRMTIRVAPTGQQVIQCSAPDGMGGQVMGEVRLGAAAKTAR
jgi:hypothetical protein